MGGMHAELAMKVQGISASEKLVLAALGTYANPANGDSCWPRMKELVKVASVSPATARAALRRLEARGFITTQAQSNDRGEQVENRYTLDVRAMTLAGLDRDRFFPPPTEIQRPPHQMPVAPPPDASAQGNQEEEPVRESGRRVASSMLPASRTRAKAKRPLPDDLALTPAMESYAQEHAPAIRQVATVFEAFRAYHAAKGSLFANWEAAWRTWVLNQQRFAIDAGWKAPRRHEDLELLPSDGLGLPEDPFA